MASSSSKMSSTGTSGMHASQCKERQRAVIANNHNMATEFERPGAKPAGVKMPAWVVRTRVLVSI